MTTPQKTLIAVACAVALGLVASLIGASAGEDALVAERPSAVPAQGAGGEDAGTLLDASNDAQTPPVPEPTVAPEVGAEAFERVYTVLMHPRCMNCHPAGDRPLQSDDSLPHAQNISRKSEAAGLKCATCHGPQNSEAVGVAGGPPGAPHWQLPPADTPMIFEGRTPTQLCEQLKQPTENGQKSLADLLDHVSHDKLVLWGWDPGGERTKPPLDHPAFVAHFQTWVHSGGACP